jgi:hypothetical protein
VDFDLPERGTEHKHKAMNGQARISATKKRTIHPALTETWGKLNEQSIIEHHNCCQSFCGARMRL